MGCPLPSTPEDENVLDSEMSDVIKAAVLGTGSVELEFSFHLLFHRPPTGSIHLFFVWFFM